MAVVVDKLDSTQAELKRRLALDPELPNFFYVQALEQTEGRGRQGRVWSSPPGNLFFSILLRGPLENITWISHRIGVAIIQSLQTLGLTDSRLKLKWPNDLVILKDRPQKLAGLIVEKIGNHFVVGIGINVAHAPVVANQATVCVAEFIPQATLNQIRDQLIQNIQKPHSFSLLKDLYLQYSMYQGGEKICWGNEQGEFIRIGEYGEMIVRLNNGEQKFLFSDDVHLVKN